MQKFTHFDFEQLSKEEEELHYLLKKQKKMQGPNRQTVNNILAYSKAYSVRASKQIDFIAHLLN